jgi:hypothetical protein
MNPLAVRIAMKDFQSLGFKKPFLARKRDFVCFLLLRNPAIFSEYASAIVLSHFASESDAGYWFGDGTIKEFEPLSRLLMFAGRNSNLLMVVNIAPIFDQLAHLLDGTQSQLAHPVPD